MTDGRVLPLAGLRVVDVTVEHAELAPRLLGDLGAEVVKVEPPEGSPARGLAPIRAGVSLSFAVRNAGKLGVALDLTDPAGVERFHELLRHADVLVTNEASLGDGLSVEEISAAHPHLVVAAATTYGLTGPWSGRVATDQVLSATGGMSFKAGVTAREPLPAPGQFCNDVASSVVAWAILCALYQREQTGAGQLLDISINECLAQTSDWSLPNWSVRNAMGFEGTDVRNGSGPVYPIFKCRDGYVRLIVLSTPQWRAMREWLGEPEYLQDEEYDTFPGRFAISDAVLNPLYEELFADMSVETVSEQAQARGIVCTPVLDPARVLTNEHFASRGTFTDLEVAPDVVARAASGYFEVDGERAGPTAPAPTVGQHTEQVFAALGEARTGAALPEPSLPLAGLRVMDFGQGAVGVEAGKLFAEYGADVLKIESRKHYDFIRVITGIEMGPSFASSSRSKRGLGVNARTTEGRDLLRELAKLSDVVIENVTTGAMDALGIGYGDLSAANPEIVMAASQLMGSRGLWADWRGYGPSTQAPGGLSYLWSYEGEEAPAGTASIFPDHFVGRLCAVGALASLIGRRRGTVHGGLVEVAQVEAVTGVISDLLAAESVEPGSVGPLGIHTERGTPGAMYRCAGDDDWVAITCRDDADWAALAGLIGSPELADDPRFATLEARRANVAEIDGLVGAWTAGLDRFEVADRCQAVGVPAGPMLHSRDLATNEHLVARGFPVPVDQPAVGTILFEGPGFFGPAIAPPVEEPAPWLGEHTEVICTELLGLDEAEVQRLIEAGVLEITPLDKRPG
jgi:crotonobetainyl-CoA:carnitine CoA-transferase CaiB-like acyl-CoA transferase